MEVDPRVGTLWWTADTLRDAVAPLGRRGLGTWPTLDPQPQDGASRRERLSTRADLPGTSARRFTPTSVGTSYVGESCRSRLAVHPPRAWGHLNIRLSIFLDQRFTPTSVGTSAQPPISVPCSSVHPHERGDIADCPASFFLSLRFTPTSVGTSRDRQFRPRRRHGSPPRAWGHHDVHRSAVWGGRFTPTSVGTSLPYGRDRSWSSVHPHERGDISARHAPSVPSVGSPPRAWGHLIVDELAERTHRFTPTSVGTSR